MEFTLNIKISADEALLPVLKAIATQLEAPKPINYEAAIERHKPVIQELKEQRMTKQEWKHPQEPPEEVKPEAAEVTEDEGLDYATLKAITDRFLKKKKSFTILDVLGGRKPAHRNAINALYGYLNAGNRVTVSKHPTIVNRGRKVNLYTPVGGKTKNG